MQDTVLSAGGRCAQTLAFSSSASWVGTVLWGAEGDPRSSQSMTESDYSCTWRVFKWNQRAKCFVLLRGQALLVLRVKCQASDSAGALVFVME